MVGAPNAVCLCADKNMLVPALFVADSVRRAASSGVQNFDVMIFTPPGDAADDFRQWAAGRGISLRDDLNLSQLQDVKILQRRLSRAALMRLLVPVSVAGQYRRILHLDADLTIHDDVGVLFELDMADTAVAAVPAGRVPAAERLEVWDWWRSHFEALGMTYPYRYFNAGVMLIDTEKWVRDDLTTRALEFIMQNGPICFYLEEDALNAVLDGAITELSPIWNFRPKEQALRRLIQPVIVHYAGRSKPWKRFGRSKRLFENLDAFRLYEAFIRESPWPDWLATQWTVRDLVASLRAEAKYHLAAFSRSRANMDTLVETLFREYFEGAAFADVEQGIAVRENGTLRLA